MNKFNVIHFVAHCLDCSWETSEYLTGRTKAAAHAKKEKHKVTGEIGKYVEYNGRRGEEGI
jgi:hypothetical protein